VANTSKNQFYQPLLFAAVLIAGMFLGFKIASSYFFDRPAFLSTHKDKPYLDHLLSLIADKYVDSLDMQTLYENGVQGIISSLDPHTVYIPPQETDQINEELQGNIYGIGIEFFIYQDTIHILSVLDNSPAKKTSIAPGDLILKIDDSLIAGKKMDDDDVIGLIKGKMNTVVSLSVQKPDGQIKQLKLKRQTIANNSITAAYVMPQQPEIGYIAIRIFSENTYAEFKEALQQLLNQHIKKLIIDVRDNPGGYMDAVTAILDELIAGKHTLLSTKSKTLTEIVESKETGLFEKGQICVLINENSASASEILAGVVQDLDRGEVIGRRSYGKGLVQEQFALPDHGAIRITVARYYLPSGRCIQKDYSHGKNEYQQEIYERFFDRKSRDSVTVQAKERKKYFTAAGRVVYGDEGVKPDLTIQYDTLYNSTMDSVFRYNLIDLFAAQYFYFHKNEFAPYSDETGFEKNFNIQPALRNLLYQYVRSQLHSAVTATLSPFQTKTDNLLKAAFAKLLLGNNARTMILNTNDQTVRAAVLQLNKN
jgi:carboxyl-terminal processing protease